jgi:hypothetical protein
MKPFTKNLHGRNHRFSVPESKNVPKKTGDRKGTKAGPRFDGKKEINIGVVNTGHYVPVESIDDDCGCDVLGSECCACEVED